MRVVIAGPRDLDGAEVTDGILVEAAMQAAASKGIVPTEVICGMARGVDILGKQWAEARGIPVVEMPAQWQRADGTTDKAAGFKRNRAMAEAAEAAVVVYDGKSKGSGNMIEEAHKRQLKVYVHRVGAQAGKHKEIPTDREADDDGVAYPKTLRTTRRIGGTLYVAGEGKRPADIAFVATALLDEEAAETQEISIAGRQIQMRPKYLKGPAGNMLKDLLMAVGIDMSDCYYTALCKSLLPRQTRLKPPVEEISKALPLLINELREVQPKIIICLGKPVFDALITRKFKFKDAKGGWFSSPLLPLSRIYVLEDVTKLLLKPEFYERFRGDFLTVKRMHDVLTGVPQQETPISYEVISTQAQLRNWVDRMLEEGWTRFSVDCEWRGRNHVDGLLRSLQVCWNADTGESVYIRFRAPDPGNPKQAGYVFDVPYEEAGKELQRLFNRPEVQFCGHHFSADAPWMYTVLGIEYFDKCWMDTEFAQQVANEHEEMGLERLALRYTSFGRYDLDLLIWKKDNPKLVGDDLGYDLIPDDLMIPYAVKDVIVPLVASSRLQEIMEREGTWEYYQEIFNPFTTSIFSDFVIQGLKVDMKKLDELRDLYSYAKVEMTKDFQRAVYAEALDITTRWVATQGIPDSTATAVLSSVFQKNYEQACAEVQSALPDDLHFRELVEHLKVAQEFNIRSHPQMTRWLFTVKGLTPVKTTGNKDKGIPSMSWEKVMELEESKRKEYKPAVDKQTIQILAEKDAMLWKLIDLNAVGNIAKSFLKPADIDADTGELIKENGLHYWIASDGRIHGMFSATETGRPRSWNPNTLNLPSWVNEKIGRGISELLNARKADGTIPQQFERYLTEKIPSIRSVFVADDGCVFEEDDYCTAELVAWAVISGDEQFIKLLTDPDPEFVLAKVGQDTEKVRVAWSDRCPVPEALRDPKFLMAYWKDGKLIQKVTEAELVRDDQGNPVHPKYDLHWDLAEMFNKKPREAMVNKKDRGAGKTGNFSTAFGSVAESLERKIEADTGVKPEEGTGQAILDALMQRQPKAFAFMEEMERLPEDPGYYDCASGRRRHFVPDQFFLRSLAGRARKSMLSRLGREARNIGPQESVAATAARAAINLQRFYRNNGMRSRVCICLYDSLSSNAHMAERFLVRMLHRKYMSEENTWDYSGRTLRYDIEQEFNKAWSWAPPKELAKKLADVTWYGNPDENPS
jgi:uracil-DNA glycosylase family 4